MPARPNCPAETVTLTWVPGHRRLEGNEVADALAKGASAMPFYGPEPALRICRTSSKHVLSREKRTKKVKKTC